MKDKGMAFPPFTDALEGEEGCLGVYPLRGDRVLLRPVDARHRDALVPLAGDAEVSRFLTRVPHPYAAADADRFLAESLAQAAAGTALTLAVERRGDGALLGVVSLERDRGDPTAAEVGYWIGRPFRGQGLALEAMSLLLSHAVDDLGFARFVAGVAEGNATSLRVLEKLGFDGAEVQAVDETRAIYASLSAMDFRTRRARPVLLVSAVALVDADNRVLLQKRPEGKALAGLWEFPGGKVDPGETPERALIRELHEELGLDIRESCLAPLTFASHATAGFHLLMPLYLCRQWKGTPTAREGQELAWVPPNRLNTFPMPPADIPLLPILRDWLA